MSEEDNTNPLSAMLHKVLEEDPKAAMTMLLLSFKASSITEFMEERKDDLTEVVEVPMTKGELIFLVGACFQSVANMVYDRGGMMNGQFIVHAFREHADIASKLAIDIEKLGYPDDSLVKDTMGMVAQIERSFERAEEEYNQIRSGEKTIENVMQGYQ